MSRAVDALPCGSRSTTSTRLPCRARQAARLTAVVVLPTPPFWLAIVITRQEAGRGQSRSPPPRAANAAWAGLIAGADRPPGSSAGVPAGSAAPPGPGTPPGPGAPSGPAAPLGPGASPGLGTSLMSGTPLTAARTGSAASEGPVAPPTGLPRVLTVPLPCESRAAIASPPAWPARLVSRETAADKACFTRAGASSRCPTLESRPCPCTSSCSITPAPSETTWGTASAAPLAARFFVFPAAVLLPPVAARYGQPSPSATRRDSSRADARESPVNSSGHPTPSWEAITALLFVPPGRPAAVIDPQSAGPLLQPDRPYRSRRGEPPLAAPPAGLGHHVRPPPPVRPLLP